MSDCFALQRVIRGIDWKLLREQKSRLLSLQHEDEDMIEGLTNLIDAIQDAAVDDGLVTNMTVFGKDAEE